MAAVKMAERLADGQTSDRQVTGVIINDESIVILPQTLGQWRARWAQVNILGVFASVLLLSMGAPFWFGLLKDLLRLRSTAITPAEGMQITTGSPAGGEKGDLNALGGMHE
jgi:hypothetical protein